MRMTQTNTTHSTDALTAMVQETYGAAARRVIAGDGLPSACCDTSCCGSSATESSDPITSNLYAMGETAELPAAAVLASLGCGNPTALAELMPGEVVLDLGSGGGIDVLLSARRVGPTGKAYGVDMTDDMLLLARRNAAEAGVTNVEFLKGQIEQLPLPDASVDVIISNCVINLSGDKRQVMGEAMRVLRPGGRFAVSDVVVKGDAPIEVRESLVLWAGCVAGALPEHTFEQLLREAGFTDISIEPTRVYDADDARAMLAGAGLSDTDRLVALLDGQLFSAFVRASKPRAPFAIRAARPDDWPAVSTLLSAAKLPLDGAEAHLADFLLAESAGRLVGVMGVERHADGALLRSAAVAATWRGGGVGRSLLEALVARSRDAGDRALFLLTETAEHWFSRFGFARISRDEVPASVQASVEFTTACPASATVMRRELA